MSNPLFEGWPTLTEEDGHGAFRFAVRTAHAEGWFTNRTEAEASLELWLKMKYESEQPPRSLADKLADAIQEKARDCKEQAQ